MVRVLRAPCWQQIYENKTCTDKDLSRSEKSAETHKKVSDEIVSAPVSLATVYKESDDSVIFKNVSRIDVDGNKLILRDIMGDERVVEGTILMVDLANSIVKLKCD